MKNIIIILAIFASTQVFAQKYFTKSGTIQFFSEAPLENIEAINSTVTAVMDASSGKAEVSALMKSFNFEKALMQEHFNENYVHSDEYPKAKLTGSVSDFSLEQLKEGKMESKFSGELTIHGETNPIDAPVNLEIKDGKVQVNSKFTILLADYNIEIPKAVTDNISETIDITVAFELKPLK